MMSFAQEEEEEVRMNAHKNKRSVCGRKNKKGIMCSEERKESERSRRGRVLKG